jgi:hypothetical protein
LRRKLPQSHFGLRKKVGVYLDPEEQARLETMAKQRSTSSSALIAGFIRDAIERESAPVSSNTSQVESLLLTILNRIAKLERVQRTLVLNTAHARGFAVGSLRTAPAESRKTIEQEVSKNFNEQKNFFFNLFPEQREGDPTDEQQKGSRES